MGAFVPSRRESPVEAPQALEARRMQKKTTTIARFKVEAIGMPD